MVLYIIINTHLLAIVCEVVWKLWICLTVSEFLSYSVIRIISDNADVWQRKVLYVRLLKAEPGGPGMLGTSAIFDILNPAYSSCRSQPLSAATVCCCVLSNVTLN